MHKYKHIFLVSIMVFNCGGYRMLESQNSIVYYSEKDNQFSIFEYENAEKDTLWKSKYCPALIQDSKIHFFFIGDPISLISNHINPDTILQIKKDSLNYTVFRINNDPYSTCSIYVSPDSTGKTNNFYYGPYTYLDLYFLDQKLQFIKYFLLAT